MSIEDDIELVRRVLDRESAAQDEFADRSLSILKGVARGRFRLPPDQVQDLSQDFYESLVDREFRKLCQWSQESPLDAWLRKSATNKCIDHIRSETRQQAQQESRSDGNDPLSAIPTGNPGPFESVNVSGKLDCVRRAMERLSERDQLIIHRKIEGYSYKKIANELQMTVNNVGVARTRALERLQREMWRLCPDYMDRNEV